MARWRLMQPHYLNVPGTEWEYKEIDQSTGRQSRKVFPVPLMLDPNAPVDWSHKELSSIIVAYAGKTTDQRDIIFEGAPTGDMEPLDEEARELSASLAANKPMGEEAFPAVGLSKAEQNFMDMLTRQMGSVPNTSVSKAAFEALQAQVAELLKQNQALQAQPKAEPTARRA